MFNINKLAYEAGYKAILDTAQSGGATLPSQRMRDRGNRLYKGWKSIGFIDLMDWCYIMMHDGDSAFSTYNWASPGNFTLTKNGTVTFTSLDGEKGDGTTGYFDTGYSALTSATHYGAENNSFGCAIKESGQEFRYVIGRTDSGSTKHILLVPRSTSDKCLAYANQTTNNIDVANTDASGLFQVVRDGVNVAVYRNSVSLGSRSDAPSESRPAGSIYLLARATTSGADTFSAKTMRMAFLGYKLTQTQREKAHQLWDEYVASI